MRIQSTAEIPYEAYVSQAIYDREMEALFQGPVWHFLGFESALLGDQNYLTTEIAGLPIVVVNDHGVIRAFVNRCVHRGSLLCIAKTGQISEFSCVYHGWTYDLEGRLTGVAFERGIQGQGGMPPDFNKSDHQLRSLKVENYCGILFGSFDHEISDFETYAGPDIAAGIRRVLPYPPILLGRTSQLIHSNWKIYVENNHDSYHASILHSFFTTFKLNRLTQSGGIVINDAGGSHISFSKRKQEVDDTTYNAEQLRSNKEDFGLKDPRALRFIDEFNDQISLQILTLFPLTVFHQISNSLCVRQVIPRGVDKVEVVWWYYGFENDSAEIRDARLMQINLVGPAGYVSMEDGAVGEFVQRNSSYAEGAAGMIKMGGYDHVSSPSRVTEAAIRGFWKQYRDHLGEDIA
ncbi:MAG: aromatic ring-hydroxylating oxygenase subunit alpha [Litorivicinaceae bacterium]